MEVHHYKYGVRDHKKENTRVKLVTYQLPHVFLATSTYAFDLTNATYVMRTQEACNFSPSTQEFLQGWIRRILFLKESFYVSSSNDFFLGTGIFSSFSPTGYVSSLRFYFSMSTLILQSSGQLT